MDMLAAESASLTLVANTELAQSLELQSKSAIDSEEGLALQSESVELQMDADREFAKAAAETAFGDEYMEQAEALHEKSAQDAIESGESLTHAEEMQLQSGELHVKSEKDRAAAALNEEKSVALLEASSKEVEIAVGAEEKAAEYEAIAIRKEGQSVKDGEAFLKTETGAMEDAEVMATCAPIPFLDLLCEALGAVIETGYQGIAAFRGAKSAAETFSAATAQRKEYAELIIAVEKQEEAARLAMEAEQFQVRADEEGARAVVEESDSEALRVEAGEEELIGDEKLKESEEEEALAVFDEERASEQYAKAARDESIALEEESSAIASEIESEELLSESTGEEFESLTERAHGEAEEAKAGNVLEQSLGHGIHALGLVLHAIITAGLVVYVVVTRGLVKTVIPCVARVWNREHTMSAGHVVGRMCGFVMHTGVVVGTIASMPSLMLHFEDMPTPLRVRALLYLAFIAGIIEALGVHSTYAVCCCHMEGMDAGPTLATAVSTFFSNVVHAVPVVLMELLILLTIAPEIFDKLIFNPLWIWVTLLVFIFIRVLKLRTAETKSLLGQLPIEGEHDSLWASEGKRNINTACDVDKEYGSMEDVSLLSEESDHTSIEIKSSSIESTSKCDPSAPNCLERCKKISHDYFEGLRLSSDILVLTLMAVLLWHCWPLLRVLHPLVKSSLGMITTWVSSPILLAAVLVLAVAVHFLFVH